MSSTPAQFFEKTCLLYGEEGALEFLNGVVAARDLAKQTLPEYDASPSLFTLSFYDGPSSESPYLPTQGKHTTGSVEIAVNQRAPLVRVLEYIAPVTVHEYAHLAHYKRVEPKSGWANDNLLWVALKEGIATYAQETIAPLPLAGEPSEQERFEILAQTFIDLDDDLAEVVYGNHFISHEQFRAGVEPFHGTAYQIGAFIIANLLAEKLYDLEELMSFQYQDFRRYVETVF